MVPANGNFHSVGSRRRRRIERRSWKFAHRSICNNHDVPLSLTNICCRCSSAYVALEITYVLVRHLRKLTSYVHFDWCISNRDNFLFTCIRDYATGFLFYYCRTSSYFLPFELKRFLCRWRCATCIFKNSVTLLTKSGKRTSRELSTTLGVLSKIRVYKFCLTNV